MAYLVTHTPEQLQKWEQIVVTDPARAVRAIAIRLDRPRTREGDTIADIYPALGAIAEAARRETGPEGYDETQWESLVQAGVVDQLCKVIVTLTPFRTQAVREDTPQHMLDSTQKDLPTPYQLPLEILGNAFINIKDPSSSAAKKLISTIKRHWKSISQRIWEDPINSLLPSEAHVLARVVFPQLCLFMITVESSILSIIHGPDDMTIPIIARYWKHATDPTLDIKICTQLLWWLIEPQHPNHEKYVKEHGGPPPELVLSRIYSGVSPKPTSSKSTQAAAFITTAAKHISTLTDVPLNFTLSMLLELHQLAQKAKDTVTEAAIRKSGALWAACVSVLRKVPEKPATIDAVSTMHALGLMVNVLHHAQFETPAEREPLIKLWVEQGLFDALEKNIDKIVTMRGAHMQIARLSICIETVLKTASPALKKQLLAQFPRWRTEGILLRYDMERQAGGVPPFFPANELPGMTSPMWIQASWQTFGSMQNACFDYSLCGRRTCGKKGEIKCICEEVLYCSENCQTKDAEAHKIACGWMALIRHGPSGKPPGAIIEEKPRSSGDDSVTETTAQVEAEA